MKDFFKKMGLRTATFLLAFIFLFTLSLNSSYAVEDYAVDDEFNIQIQEQLPNFDNDNMDWGTSGNDFLWENDYNTTTDLEAGEAALAFGIVGIIWLIALLPAYIYFALVFMTIAKKLGLTNGWFAWVPILNIILFFQCAGLSPWLFLTMFIPLVNFFVAIYAWMKLAERRGFEMWLGILIIVPIANIIIPGYLAWAEPNKSAPTPAPQQ